MGLSRGTTSSDLCFKYGHWVKDWWKEDSFKKQKDQLTVYYTHLDSRWWWLGHESYDWLLDIFFRYSWQDLLTDQMWGVRERGESRTTPWFLAEQLQELPLMQIGDYETGRYEKEKNRYPNLGPGKFMIPKSSWSTKQRCQVRRLV